MEQAGLATITVSPGDGSFTEHVLLTDEGRKRADAILARPSFSEPDDAFTAALLHDVLAIARSTTLFRGWKMRRLVRAECARRQVDVPAKVQGFLDGWGGRR